MEWFYEENGQSVGPITTDALQDLIRDGIIQTDRRVWCEAFGDQWRRISDVSEFCGQPPPLHISQTDLHPETSNRELMARARKRLKGRWGLAIVVNIIYGGIFYGFSLGFNFMTQPLFRHVIPTVDSVSGRSIPLPYIIHPVLINIFQSIPYAALLVGLAHFFLNVMRVGAKPRMVDLFTALRTWKFYKHCLVAYWLRATFSLLWALLFIIPGVMAALSYSQTYYILLDHPEMTALEAISRSKRIMFGYRWKLFCLHCRFIGWSLLCFLSCGIGLLWLIPYVQVSLAHFYESVKSRA